MSKILSIGTALPRYCHKQQDILEFMARVYAPTEVEKRKMRFLYQHSGIDQRYSVIPDYSLPATGWNFYPPTENLEPFPSLEQRMRCYREEAPRLSMSAIEDCLKDRFHALDITHLITVSCTGMSAPGLDLQIMEQMELRQNLVRTSVNFMGCYAAIHALKLADAFCKADPEARVMVVCTELCTLHFQRDTNMDNIASSMLFGDGSAAVLVVSNSNEQPGIELKGFYSEVLWRGKQDMAWELSSNGFLMTLSGYIPELIEADFKSVVSRAQLALGLKADTIEHWCIHPGGKRILEVIAKSMHMPADMLHNSYQVLKEVGNLSSATLLFVLKKIMEEARPQAGIFAAAFGPGLTMETFAAHAV